MRINLIEAIVALDKNARVSVNETKGKIIWHCGNQKNLSEEQIQAKLSELQSEYDAQTYSRNRQKNYPNEHDLLIALWEKVMEGRGESADALEVKRQEVKTTHPKPE